MLLYCAGGTVLATHSDEQDVPASAYLEAAKLIDGANAHVRIIPYSKPLSTLERVGDLPQPRDDELLPADPRPFATPPPDAELLTAFTSQVRYQTQTGGTTWNGIAIDTSEMSQLQIGNLAKYADKLDADIEINFVQNGVVTRIKAGAVRDLYDKVNAFLQECRDIEGACINDLRSSTPEITKYRQVEARFASLQKK